MAMIMLPLCAADDRRTPSTSRATNIQAPLVEASAAIDPEDDTSA
jgi:hypothetical protein